MTENLGINKAQIASLEREGIGDGQPTGGTQPAPVPAPTQPTQPAPVPAPTSTQPAPVQPQSTTPSPVEPVEESPAGPGDPPLKSIHRYLLEIGEAVPESFEDFYEQFNDDKGHEYLDIKINRYAESIPFDYTGISMEEISKAFQDENPFRAEQENVADPAKAPMAIPKSAAEQVSQLSELGLLDVQESDRSILVNPTDPPKVSDSTKNRQIVKPQGPAPVYTPDFFAEVEKKLSDSQYVRETLMPEIFTATREKGANPLLVPSYTKRVAGQLKREGFSDQETKEVLYRFSKIAAIQADGFAVDLSMKESGNPLYSLDWSAAAPLIYDYIKGNFQVLGKAGPNYEIPKPEDLGFPPENVMTDEQHEQYMEARREHAKKVFEGRPTSTAIPEELPGFGYGRVAPLVMDYAAKAREERLSRSSQRDDRKDAEKYREIMAKINDPGLSAEGEIASWALGPGAYLTSLALFDGISDDQREFLIEYNLKSLDDIYSTYLAKMNDLTQSKVDFGAYAQAASKLGENINRQTELYQYFIDNGHVNDAGEITDLKSTQAQEMMKLQAELTQLATVIQESGVTKEFLSQMETLEDMGASIQALKMDVVENLQVHDPVLAEKYRRQVYFQKKKDYNYEMARDYFRLSENQYKDKYTDDSFGVLGASANWTWHNIVRPFQNALTTFAKGVFTAPEKLDEILKIPGGGEYGPADRIADWARSQYDSSQYIFGNPTALDGMMWSRDENGEISMDWSLVPSKVSEGIAQLFVFAGAGQAYGAYAGVTGAVVIQSMDDYYEEARRNGFSDHEAATIAFSTSMAVGISESVFMNPTRLVFGAKPVDPKVFQREIFEQVRNGQTLKEAIGSVTGKTFQGALGEAVDEHMNYNAEWLSKNMWNGVGDGSFDTGYDHMRNLEGMTMGFMVGGIAGGGRGSYEATTLPGWKRNVLFNWMQDYESLEGQIDADKSMTDAEKASAKEFLASYKEVFDEESETLSRLPAPIAARHLAAAYDIESMKQGRVPYTSEKARANYIELSKSIAYAKMTDGQTLTEKERLLIQEDRDLIEQTAILKDVWGRLKSGEITQEQANAEIAEKIKPKEQPRQIVSPFATGVEGTKMTDLVGRTVLFRWMGKARKGVIDSRENADGQEEIFFKLQDGDEFVIGLASEVGNRRPAQVLSDYNRKRYLDVESGKLSATEANRWDYLMFYDPNAPIEMGASGGVAGIRMNGKTYTLQDSAFEEVTLENGETSMKAHLINEDGEAVEVTGERAENIFILNELSQIDGDSELAEQFEQFLESEGITEPETKDETVQATPEQSADGNTEEVQAGNQQPTEGQQQPVVDPNTGQVIDPETGLPVEERTQFDKDFKADKSMVDDLLDDGTISAIAQKILDGNELTAVESEIATAFPSVINDAVAAIKDGVDFQSKSPVTPAAQATEQAEQSQDEIPEPEVLENANRVLDDARRNSIIESARALEDVGKKQKAATAKAAAKQETKRGTKKGRERAERIRQMAADNNVRVRDMNDLYDVYRDMFGLDEEQSYVAALASDKLIETMAAREGTSKRKIYDRLAFAQGSESMQLIDTKLQQDQVAEMENIKAKAIADGTFMKAPNIKSATENDGSFDPAKAEIRLQEAPKNARGAVMVSEDGRAIVYALTDPNVSTPLHEFAHIFEHYLTDAERQAVKNAAKTETWTRQTSEYFARGFEQYLMTGVAPSSQMQALFDAFAKWMTEIYVAIAGSDVDVELNDEMRQIYGLMFSGESTTLEDVLDTQRPSAPKSLIEDATAPRQPAPAAGEDLSPEQSPKAPTTDFQAQAQAINEQHQGNPRMTVEEDLIEQIEESLQDPTLESIATAREILDEILPPVGDRAEDKINPEKSVAASPERAKLRSDIEKAIDAQERKLKGQKGPLLFQENTTPEGASKKVKNGMRNLADQTPSSQSGIINRAVKGFGDAMSGLMDYVRSSNTKSFNDFRKNHSIMYEEMVAISKKSGISEKDLWRHISKGKSDSKGKAPSPAERFIISSVLNDAKRVNVEDSFGVFNLYESIDQAAHTIGLRALTGSKMPGVDFENVSRLLFEFSESLKSGNLQKEDAFEMIDTYIQEAMSDPKIKKIQEEIAAAKQARQALKESAAQRVSDLRERLAAEKAALKEKHAAEKAALKEKHAEKIEQQRQMRQKAIDREKARKDEAVLREMIKQEQIKERARQREERIATAQNLVRQFINETAVAQKGNMTVEELKALNTMLQKTKTERDVEKAIAEVEYRTNLAEARSVLKQLEAIISDNYVQTKDGIKRPRKVDPETAAYFQMANEIYSKFKKLYKSKDALGGTRSFESTEKIYTDFHWDYFSEAQAIRNEISQIEDGSVVFDQKRLDHLYNRRDAINLALAMASNLRGVEKANKLNPITKGMRDGQVMLSRLNLIKRDLESAQDDLEGGRALRKEDAERRAQERAARLDDAITDISRRRKGVLRFDTGSQSETGMAQRAATQAETWMNMHMDINNLLNSMSYNNGTLAKLGEDLQRGEKVMRDMRMEKEKMIKEAQVSIFGEKYKSTINGIRKGPSISFQTETKTGPSQVELNQFQAAYLYNQWKNESVRHNIGKLIAPTIDENGKEVVDSDLAEARMRSIENYLDPRVKLYADWKTNVFFPSFQEAVAAVYMEIYGAPIDFVNMYSGQLMLEQDEATSDDPIQDMQNSFGMRPKTPGPIKARSGSNKAILAVDDEIATQRYLADISKWVGMAAPYRNLEGVLKNAEFIRATKKNNLEKQRTAVLEIMQSAMVPKKVTEVERLLSGIANNYYTAKLAFTLPTALKQVTSFVFAPAADPTGVVNHYRTIGNLLGDLGKSAVTPGQTSRLREVYRVLKSESSLLYERYESEDAFMRAISDLTDNDRTKLTPKSTAREVMEKVRRWQLAHVKWGDKVAVLSMMAIYESVYQKEMALHGNHDSAHQEALFRYEYAVKKTQQSNSALDKDQIQLNSATRFLNAFMTAPKQQFREEVESLREMARSIRGEGYVTRDWQQNAYRFASNHVMVPVMVELLTEFAFAAIWSDDDDRETEVWKRALRAGVVGNANSFTILGKMLDYGARRTIHGDETRWYERDLVLSMMPAMEGQEDAGKAIVDVLNDPTIENWMKAMMEVFSVTGFGAENFLRWIDNLLEIPESEDVGEMVMRILNYSETMFKEWGYDGNFVNSGQINPIAPPPIAPPPIAPPPIAPPR